MLISTEISDHPKPKPHTDPLLCRLTHSTPLVSMSAPSELVFFVNGRKVVEKEADPEEVLLSFLRRKVGLTGTKYGCGGGGCGACTVMVSRYDRTQERVLHYTVNACLQPIVTLHGAAVVTVEGIGSTKTKLHPVQERIAKAHGSQCGFCTPGMVMSMYTLLRNKPQPSMEDIREALGGNLCRCTGYRPIIDGFKTFCEASGCCQNGGGGGGCCLEDGSKNGKEEENDVCQELFPMEDFLPLDPSQDLIFPPELMITEKNVSTGALYFHGERVNLVAPSELLHLLELKAEHPSAPLIVGNTTIGPKMLLQGVHHPLVIYAGRVSELAAVTWGKDGLTVGAACSLSRLKEEVEKAVAKMEEAKARGYRALLQTLQCLAGRQIRNMATVGGNLLSANPKYDLSSVLAALECTLRVTSKDGMRSVPLDEKLFTDFGKMSLRPDEVLLSIQIPNTKSWEFVAVYRQAQRRELAFSFVNAGMKVAIEPRSDIVKKLSIFYGGVGPTLVKPTQTCQQLVGRSWGQDLLSEACGLLKDDVDVSKVIHGGRAEYRKTLAISFFFKFYMHVVLEISERGVADVSLPLEYLSALEPFRNEVPQGQQSFQLVPESQPCTDPVGRPSMHQSAFQQATGEAKYYDDLPPVQGELFIFMVTSTRAHAKIIDIDPSDALKSPGGVAFVSAGDVPGANRRLWFNNPEELFAEEEVLCVGQIIGAVVAENREQARRAAQKVRITYQDLHPVFFTIADAIKHESYFEPKRKVERGDVDAAFRTAEHIFEDEIYMGGQEHFYMETQGLIAVPRGEDEEMDLFVATQHAAFTQELVGMALGVDSNKITCHVKRLGGGFGGKIMKIASLSAITAVAARKTGRAVRCCLERGDDMLITGGRHPFLGKYKVGYNSDGTIVAADITYYSNGGCTLDESGFIMDKAILHMDNAYKIPNLRGRGVVCKTYLPSYTAFRGFGGPQGLTVMESVLHEVAVRCGLPPEKVREVNMYREELCYTHYKQPFCPTDMVRCWDECLERADYQERLRAVRLFNASNRWKKRGIAAVPQKFGVGFSKGFYNQGAALVNIFKDGSVLVTHGGTEMGQGIHTKAIQIASRILKIPMSSIFIKETCTGNVPNAAPSAASFGTDAVGMAVKDACEKLMRRLQPLMERNPKHTWKQWINEAFFQKISLSATGFFMGPSTGVDWEKGEGQAYYYFTYGACCSEVEIDCLTGDHKNIRTDIVMDVGKSINSALDVGQVEGGFVQGVGLYTIEELQFSPDGVLMSRGPSRYKIPALCDVPAELNVHLLADAENPNAIYLSKGIGEPPVFFGATIFFAIKAAIAAARQERELGENFRLSSPATAEKIRMACQDQFTDMASPPVGETAATWCIDV
ncbi:aldehyde oxidase 5 isoform X2 [Parambassis ranga]|uniref:Aldehyde oxidase 5 isoform X2 n=1 Tax=Parambassis ranga TaxID=210632 RepID=A0A6P7JVR5_9TELE|nr:aldehyde oxidase 3-like isoform X2 [Parambassis ranga]